MKVTNKAHLAEAIYRLAEYIDADCNEGHYYRYLPEAHRWVTLPPYKVYRDGILYYSAGHGWRVRKKPHWRDVFKTRFSQWYEIPDAAKE